MQLTVVRTDLSTYLGDAFLAQEREMVEALGLAYQYGEIPPNSPWILISNTQSQLKNWNKDEWERLKLIVHPNSGYDNFPPEIVKKASFPIIIGNSIRAHAVANYILSAVWQHYTSISHQRDWHRERTWERPLLNQKSFLIIGHGHIGKLISESLSPICKKLQIYDPFKGYTELDLNEVDAVLLCSSLNPSSAKIIDKEFLKQLPEDFLLVNAARGGLVDQSALLHTLLQRPNAKAVLDVFEKEPYNAEDFQSIENIITTSHIAGVSGGLNQAMLDFERSALIDFLQMGNDRELFAQKYHEQLLQNRYHDGFLL